MISVRIVFKGYQDKKFVAFTMSEAKELIDEYDVNDVLSIHFYPHYNE